MASEIEEKHVYNSNSNELSGSKNEFALNVGGRGATQRRLRDYQVAMIGQYSAVGGEILGFAKD